LSGRLLTARKDIGWNSQVVQSLFPDQSVCFFTKAPDGRVDLNSGTVAMIIRELVESEGAGPQAWSAKEKAHELAKELEE